MDLYKMKQESYKNYTQREARAAVKQDGPALQYVKEQSEALCLAAVRQNGYALQYVDERCLSKKEACEMTLAQISEALGFEVKIVKGRE